MTTDAAIELFLLKNFNSKTHIHALTQWNPQGSLGENMRMLQWNNIQTRNFAKRYGLTYIKGNPGRTNGQLLRHRKALIEKAYSLLKNDISAEDLNILFAYRRGVL